MKRTTYIWIMTLLVFVGIFTGIYLTYQGVFSSDSRALSFLHYFVRIVLDFVLTLITIVCFVKLYELKSGVFRWINILFGYGLFYNFVGIVLAVLSFGPLALLVVIPIIGASLLGVILWITFYNHL